VLGFAKDINMDKNIFFSYRNKIKKGMQ